jgi:hypothetical protein
MVDGINEAMVEAIFGFCHEKRQQDLRNSI